MNMNSLLLDAAMVSIKSLQTAKVAPEPTKNPPKASIQKGLHESIQSINASLQTLQSNRKSTSTTVAQNNNTTYLKSMKRRRRGARLVEVSTSTNTSNNSNNSNFQYGGVQLNGKVGSLTLSGDRLVFQPRDPRNVSCWPLESILKHQMTGNQLRLLVQPQQQVVTLTFPDSTCLDKLHSHLTHQLQPLRKYRKLKETLLHTQRKLKEANRCIDDMQDANETLLISCDALGRKCKSLTEQLQQQKQMNGAEEMEALRNEKTAMAICHEMDMESLQTRIAALEKELAEEREALEEEREALEEERATTERLLEEREQMDGLQMEVHMLTRMLAVERNLREELQARLESEKEWEDVDLEQMRQMRNDARRELATVKKERDNLQRQLEECEAQKKELLQQQREQHAPDQQRTVRGVRQVYKMFKASAAGTKASVGETLKAPPMDLSSCPPVRHYQKAVSPDPSLNAFQYCGDDLRGDDCHGAYQGFGLWKSDGDALMPGDNFSVIPSRRLVGVDDCFHWKGILGQVASVGLGDATVAGKMKVYHPRVNSLLPVVVHPSLAGRLQRHNFGAPEYRYGCAWWRNNVLSNSFAGSAPSDGHWSLHTFVDPLPVGTPRLPLTVLPDNTPVGRGQRQFLLTRVLTVKTVVKWNPDLGSDSRRNSVTNPGAGKDGKISASLS